MTNTIEKPLTEVELARDGPVATLTLTTPSGVNILSSPVLGALGQHVQRIAEDASIRFVVFRGSGKTFAAGADIAQMSHFDEGDGQSYSKNGHHVFDAVAALPQVTFAAINGHALGGGCELALACDFRIASANAKLGQPESRLGLVPGWGGTLRLPRLVGPAVAKRLMFSGEQISADEALRLGLVDEVVAAPEALPGVLAKWFERIKPGSPAAIRRIKHAMLHGDETKQFAMCFSCSDAKEGMTAFLEKRAASWMA
jgi:enoyl-CoA hydratase